MKTLLLAVIGALVSVTLYAQASSQIQGTVLDSTGAAVPGAEVKATQAATGAVRTVNTGADGAYVLSNLPIGPYRLEVSKQGFANYVQTGIVLQVATNPTIEVSLKVGNVSEQVQVEANATLVETQATGIGAVIDNRRILELPLNGRVATDLIGLAGAVIAQGVAGNGGFPGTQQYVINGGQSFGDAFWLDGSVFNNPWDNANMPFPFPDALQEFKVENQRVDGAKWRPRRRDHYGSYKVRHQQFPWRCVRVPPKRRSQRNQLLHTHQRRAQAEPVWRDRGRSGEKGQAVLLFWLSGYDYSPDVLRK